MRGSTEKAEKAKVTSAHISQAQRRLTQSQGRRKKPRGRGKRNTHKEQIDTRQQGPNINTLLEKNQQVLKKQDKRAKAPDN